MRNKLCLWYRYGSDANFDCISFTRVVVPSLLAPATNFNITNTIIQLLNLKELFSGVDGDNPNLHLMNFVGVCKFYELPEISKNIIQLHLFPLSLFGEATLWLNELLHVSITNWMELKTIFLERFFPHSKMLQLRDKINNWG